MPKRLTKIKPTMSPASAREIRDTELESAQKAYTEACRATNSAFAEVVLRAADRSSMSMVAHDLGMSRVYLHNVVRKAKDNDHNNVAQPA